VEFEAKGKRHDYVRSLVFFILGMLGKISVSPMPAVLLLFVWWRRRRLGVADLKAVTPFLVLVVIVNLLCFQSYEYYWQHVRERYDVLPHLEPAARLILAGQLLLAYCAHFVWPVDLLPVYPQWTLRPASLLSYLPWLAPVGVFVLLAFKIKTWGRHAMLGLGTFILLLAPFLGFVTAPYMMFTWLIDHVLYIPIIGLVGLVAATVGAAQDRAPASGRIFVTGATTLIAALLAFEAHAYGMVYTDEASLWTYTLVYNPDSWLAHYNLANELFLAGNYPQAIAHYEAALRTKPDYVVAHNNLGLAYAQTGRLPEAKTQFEAALQLMPTYAGAQRNLAHVEALLNATPAKP
jgi:hypothetical protein